MFEFSGNGSREGVTKALLARKLPANNDPKQEVRYQEAVIQAEEFKKFVAREIESLPAEFNGCNVTANASFNTSSRQASVTIVGQKLHL